MNHMDDLLLEERIRYPPFESYRFRPQLLPIGVARTEISKQITRDEANEIVSDMPPPFRIGDKKSWLVERRYIYQGKTLKLNKTHNQEMSEAVPKDSVIHKQRTGWYLTPNLIHSQARKIMNFSVIILLIALSYLFFEPILSLWGIPSIGTGRVRFGLLDYPLLAVIVVPILFIPIIMRVGANFSDLIKQRRFLSAPPPEPEIKFHSDTTSGENLVVEIEFPQAQETWGKKHVLWRVGVSPPRSDTLMEGIGRDADGHPAPGFPTELPHHWSVDLDDGTGGGEDLPMQTNEIKGGLFLKPMRIMNQSEIIPLADGPTTISPPSGKWPGTIFSSLIRIHWELIVVIERENQSELLWVQPLKVKHSSNYTETTATVNSGRAETNHPMSLS